MSNKHEIKQAINKVQFILSQLYQLQLQNKSELLQKSQNFSTRYRAIQCQCSQILEPSGKPQCSNFSQNSDYSQFYCETINDHPYFNEILEEEKKASSQMRKQVSKINSVLKGLRKIAQQLLQILLTYPKHAQTTNTQFELASQEQIFVFVNTIFSVCPQASISIEGSSRHKLIKADGNYSAESMRYLQLLATLLILMAKIKKIIHNNTDKQHHSQFYQKLNALQYLSQLLRYPQFKKDGYELWRFKKPFVTQAKKDVIGLRCGLFQLETLAIYCEIKEISKNIQIQEFLAMEDIVNFYNNIPEPDIEIEDQHPNDLARQGKFSVWQEFNTAAINDQQDRQIWQRLVAVGEYIHAFKIEIPEENIRVYPEPQIIPHQGDTH